MINPECVHDICDYCEKKTHLSLVRSVNVSSAVLNTNKQSIVCPSCLDHILDSLNESEQITCTECGKGLEMFLGCGCIYE